MPLAAGLTGPVADQSGGKKKIPSIFKQETGALESIQSSEANVTDLSSCIAPNLDSKSFQGPTWHNFNAHRVTPRLSQATLPLDKERDIVAILVFHEA